MEYNHNLQRYYNEHIHLPDTFFSQPKLFVKHALVRKEQFLVTAYNYVEPGMDGSSDVMEYSDTDFKVMGANTAGRICVLMQPPTPTQTLQCMLMGCSIKHDGSNPVWRTIELSEEGKYLLCGWAQGRTHMLIGEVETDPEQFVPAMIKELTTAQAFDVEKFKAELKQMKS